MCLSLIYGTIHWVCIELDALLQTDKLQESLASAREAAKIDSCATSHLLVLRVLLKVGDESGTCFMIPTPKKRRLERVTSTLVQSQNKASISQFMSMATQGGWSFDNFSSWYIDNLLVVMIDDTALQRIWGEICCEVLVQIPLYHAKWHGESVTGSEFVAKPP